MVADELWNIMMQRLEKSPLDIHTIPSNRRHPLWFTAFIEDGMIYVYNSKDKTPSTRMAQKRLITREDFNVVYEFYYRWSSGERYLRQIVRTRSRNVAYIFGLICFFEQSEIGQ